MFNLTRAVDRVSFKVAAGETVGFLGPNGAGKTTTIKMISGLLQPDSGTILINGVDLAKDPLACKRITGYIPDRPFLYEKLTGHEYLCFIAGLYGIDPHRFAARVPELLERFDLTGWTNHLIEGYSHGMRQKLVFTSVLMRDPQLLVIDEPMVGLDPKSARLVKRLLHEQARSGAGVLLSTHSLEVAEELCDRIVIIDHGRVVESGTMEELRAKAKRPGSDLEELFLTVTGAAEYASTVAALKRENGKAP